MLVVVALGLLTQTPDPEAQIRAARKRSNEAIAARDLDALADSWTEDVHVVTSRSAEASGREAERAAFEAQFRDRPDVLYVRTPERIEVFVAWRMASEAGTWEGRWTEPDGVVSIGGTYFAKWHRSEDGRWRIRAEIFVPTRCSGSSYCLGQLNSKS